MSQKIQMKSCILSIAPTRVCNSKVRCALSELTNLLALLLINHFPILETQTRRKQEGFGAHGNFPLIALLNNVDILTICYL